MNEDECMNEDSCFIQCLKKTFVENLKRNLGKTHKPSIELAQWTCSGGKVTSNLMYKFPFSKGLRYVGIPSPITQRCAPGNIKIKYYQIEHRCLPNAVGKQPSIPLINLGRKWMLNWWWWWSWTTLVALFFVQKSSPRKSDGIWSKVPLLQKPHTKFGAHRVRRILNIQESTYSMLPQNPWNKFGEHRSAQNLEYPRIYLLHAAAEPLK